MEEDLISTNLVDLSSSSLADMREVDADDLRSDVEQIFRQLAKPRYNLGSSGPPGRVD